MDKNKKLEKQNLFFKRPISQIEIHHEQRANSIGYFNNALRDYTIKRIEKYIKKYIKTLSQDYGKSTT